MFLIVARLRRRAFAMPRRSPLTSVTPALSIATSVPVPHGDSDLCLGKGWGVIDSVAGHGDDSSL